MIMDEHTHAVFKDVPLEELDPSIALEAMSRENAKLRKRNEHLEKRITEVTARESYQTGFAEGKARLQPAITRAQKEAARWKEMCLAAEAKLKLIEEVLFGDRCPTCG